MYPVTWDPDTRGILLLDHPSANEVAGEIRPVFFEELDLLGFDQHWSYPRTAEPLLWAVGRRYYQSGASVAEAKGGGFYAKPTIVLQREQLELEPVDVPAMLQRNAALLEGLAFRALEFVHAQHRQRKRSTDVFCVAFSGGKDSLAMLDLVQRSLAPDEFVVVFADTTMELQVTYDSVEWAQRRYPQLQFHAAQSHLSATESWRLFGPPSRVHRWCCSVHKTAPTMLKLREIVGTLGVDVVVFDGCRRAESQRRFGYEPVSASCKHPTQVNVSPLLEWSSAETFLYLLRRELKTNQGYRLGFARVGCAVCPVASQWWDGLAWMVAPDTVQPFVSMLLDLGRSMGVPENEVHDFVRGGGWRGRAGGRALEHGGNRVLITETPNSISLKLREFGVDWLEWAKTLGTISREGDDTGSIASPHDGMVYPFRMTAHEKALEIDIGRLQTADRFLRRDIRSVSYKAAYCVQCRSCEAECPTGALRIDGSVRIDDRLCIHCSNCLGFVRKGCWAAKSLSISEEGSPMKLKTYQHFGLRQQWLDEFLAKPECWWYENSLGPRQFDAMKMWLVDAELSAANQITEMGSKIQEIGGVRSPLAWHVIWCNLTRNSSLVNWYVAQVPWYCSYSREQLVGMLPERFSLSTRQNAIRALIGLLRDTPLGTECGLGRVAVEGGSTKSVSKEGSRSTPPLAVLYCLYRYAEAFKRYDLSVSELVEDADKGPIAIYGLVADELPRLLRGLSAQYPAWIKTEIVRDLDNVYLEPTNSAAGVMYLA